MVGNTISVMSAHDKLTITKKILNGELTITEASIKYQVSRKTLYQWVTKYKNNPSKKKLFYKKYKSGSKHPRYKRQLTEKQLLRLIQIHPEWSNRQFVNALKAKGISTSVFSVNKILNSLGLERKDLRESRNRNYAGPGRLLSDVRFEVVQRKYSGESIAALAKAYKVSRKTIYTWLRQYDDNPVVLSLQDRYVNGENHPKALYPRITGNILNIVRENPDYSAHKISKLVDVSSWTVWKILDNHQLNSISQRKLYAQQSYVHEKVVPTSTQSDRVRSVWEQFVPTRAPAPPPSIKTSFFDLFSKTRPIKIFISSLVISFIASLGSIFFVSTLRSAETISSALGLVFASVALFFGGLFFVYSLKYYLSLVIVLSFSQRTGENKINGSSSKKGLLSWLLGIEATANEEGSSRSMPVGLEPDLESVHLKKYPYVSVQIPFYNEKNVVLRSLNAAANFDYPEYEVIFCDDSTDTTPQIIRSEFNKLGKVKKIKGDGWTLESVELRPGVTLKHLHRTSRSGFKGAALKLALTLVDPRTEFISIFDADFVPYPDSLTLFLKYFKLQNANSEEYTKTNVAAVQGYQWHTLNKSENWITRGVRSEYAGSYVIERSGIEIYGGLKQISGSVYMIRRDALENIGWGTSITEDFELTLKLYNAGYKVIYTPYIQAPAECVSTLKRLIRQRMRWAEGHSNNVKKMGWQILLNPNVSIAEKLEFLYLAPYYLQAFFFIAGTICWLASEVLFPARLPFWTAVWGWSLVLTNLISLPLLNAVGLFLEESEERDYVGLLSFIVLSYILVPFQAYAAIKGFIEKEEGPWFRTPKTGRVTDIVARGRFMRLIAGIFHGFKPAVEFKGLTFPLVNQYAFSYGTVKKSGVRKAVRFLTVILLLVSLNISYLTIGVDLIAEATGKNIAFGAQTKEKPTENSSNKNIVKENIDKYSSLVLNPYIKEGNSFLKDVRQYKKYAYFINKYINEFKKKLAIKISRITRITYKLKSDRSDFKGGESPKYKLSKRSGLRVPILTDFISRHRSLKAEVIASDSSYVKTFDLNNSSLVEIPTNDLQPGEYTLKVKDDNGNTYAQEKFTWGVLAINTDKSFYINGESAYIQMAALSEQGHTSCNANLLLEIIDPKAVKHQYSTDSGTIEKSDTCGADNVTDNPDYFVNYKTEVTGIYKLKLTNTHTKWSVEDTFTVQNESNISVKRVAATRINPYQSSYTMNVHITSVKAFKGEIVEEIPSSFVLENENGYRIEKKGDRQLLIWNADINANEENVFSYTYRAPQVSPELYLLGPVSIGEYKEGRQWQIAADAISRAWSTGFELQSVTNNVEFDTNTGTISVDTSIKRSGNASLKSNPSSSTGFITHGFRANATAAVYIRAYVYITTAPSALTTIIGYTNTSDTYGASIRLATDRTLELWQGTTTAKISTSSSALDLYTWHRVELFYDDANANNTTTGYLDGTQFATGNGANLGGGGRVRFGIQTSTTGDINMDDIAVDVGELPGSGRIVHVMPNATGDSDNGVTSPASQTGYTVVDEVPPNMPAGGGTDYYIFEVTTDILDVNVQDASTVGIDSADTIRLVQVGANIVALTAANATYNTRIKSQASGTVTSGTGTVHALAVSATNWRPHDDTADTRAYKLTSLTDPQAGGAWTPSLIDSMQIGATVSDANPDTNMTSLWGLVEYTKPTLTVSGSIYSAIGGTTPAAVCDANAGTFELKLRSNGSNYSASCSNADGSFSFSSVESPGTGGTFVIWIDGLGTDGAMVIRYDGSGNSTSNIMYESTVTVTSDDTNPVTNALMDTFDNGQDGDIPYTVTSSNLTVNSGMALLVKIKSGVSAGSTVYDPGGTVTTNATSGKIHVDDDSVAYLDTASNSIGTDVVVDGGGILYIDAITTINGGDITLSGTGAVNTSTGTSLTTIVGAGTLGGGSGAITLYSLKLTSTGTTTLNANLNITSDFTIGDASNAHTFDNETNDKTLDVNGSFVIDTSSTFTSSSSATQTIAGSYTNNGTLTEGTGTLTFDGATANTFNSGCADAASCTTKNFNNLIINKTNTTDTVTLTTNHLNVAATFTITKGTFVQGALNVRVEGSTAVSVGANGTWTNTSTGDIALGGTVSNSGTMTLQGTTSACGETDAISITSTGAQRAWSGSGTFNFNDLSVQDQGGTASITVYSGTSVSGNNTNWTFESVCPAGLSLSTASNTIQVDSPGKYRAVMTTNQTTNYVVISDRGQDDGSPSATQEFKSPCILEGGTTYCLRRDSARISTILENTTTRVKVRVMGKFMNEAGSNYLGDESGTSQILTVTEDYTFTLDGIFVANTTDFRATGVTLDAASGHNGYEWMGVYTDGTDAAYDDTGNITYGNGQAQTDTSTDGAFANSNTYVYMPGAGSVTYQDAFVGIMRTGWYDDTTGGTHQWNWDEDETGTQDLITAQEQNHLTKGIHQAKWYFLIKPEASMDTQAERESINNDYWNPDILSHTIGAEWNDTVAASSGLYFTASDRDHIAISGLLGSPATVTVMGWAYYTAADLGGSDFISIGDIVTIRLESGANNIQGLYHTSGGGWAWIDSTFTSLNSGWHHYAYVLDPGSSYQRFYIDGVETAQGTSATSIGYSGVGSNTYVGRHGNGNADYDFQGMADDIRVYNARLTQAQVQENMFNQVSASSTNLLASWRLNENTGQNVFDETTNNYDGTLGADANSAADDPTWTTGYVADHYNRGEAAYTSQISRPSGGLTLDGTDDYVNIPTVNNRPTTAATVTAWAKGTVGGNNWGNNDAVWMFGPSSNHRLYATGNEPKLQLQDTSGARVQSSVFSGYLDNVWYNYVVVLPAGTDQPAQWYINGSLYTTVSPTAGFGWDFSLFSQMNMGGGSNSFDGDIDEVRLYNTALSASDIKSAMASEISTSASGLVGYWKLNDGSGQTVTDSTTSASNGTLGATSGSSTDDPTWATGILSADQNGLNVDIDADTNISTTLSGALTAGSTSISVSSTTSFSASGVAYIDGDKFSYTGTSGGNTFTGVPSTGELAVIGHASGAVVSSMNRHAPYYKVRGYRSNSLPSQITMEGSTLVNNSTMNSSYKPFTNAYFMQDIAFYAPLQTATVDIGSDITNSGCAFVAAKYGLGLECNADSEDAAFTSTSNIDYVKGALEFWMRPQSASTDGVERTFFNIISGSDQFRLRKTTGNTLEFLIHDGTNSSTESVTSSNYSWAANDWVHIRLEWDDSAVAADAQKIYINGVEPGTHTDGNTDWVGSSVSPGTTFELGNDGAAGTVECNCILDEFVIYDFNGSGGSAIDQIGAGGNTGDTTNETLASSATNTTFSFAAVDSGGRGEYVYFGSDSMVTGLNISLGTNGATAGTLNLDWEYWNGTSWTSLETLEGFMDSTFSLTQSGTVSWNQNPPGWFTYGLMGAHDQYYVRVSLNNGSGSYSTSPIESLIYTDILLINYLSNLSSNDQTFVIVPEYGLYIIIFILGIELIHRKKYLRNYGPRN